MYTPTVLSVYYEKELGIGLKFDIGSFNDLIESSVMLINCAIEKFKNDKKNSSKDTLMNQIGLSVEIIEHSILLEAQFSEIKIKSETKKAIKKLLPEIDELIENLGKFDSDFISMSSTRRARPPKEVLDYIQKKNKKEVEAPK